MDESWRLELGQLAPRRRSTTDHPRHRRPPDHLDPDDFRDVYGGPPRTVLLRRFSGEMLLPRPGSFYDEVFRSPELRHGEDGCGRSLPEFRIPTPAARRGGGGGLVRMEEGFYDDIFGSDGKDRRSRSRSKSKSGSSSERSPQLRAAAEDPMLASFASKLRPITIPSRQQGSSPPSTFSMGEQSSQRSSTIQCQPRSCFIDFQHRNNCSSSNPSACLTRQRSHVNNNYFSCCFSPPESISIEPSFHGSINKHKSGIDSPSSVISTFFLDPVASKAVSSESWLRAELEPEKVVMQVEEAGAVESSYVIEINSSGAEDAREAAAVDEAIAWAKEFWSQMPKENETSEEKNETKENKERTARKECSFIQRDQDLEGASSGSTTK